MVVVTSCFRFNPSTPLTAAPSVPVLALPLTDDEEEEDEGEGSEDTNNDEEETVVVALPPPPPPPLLLLLLLLPISSSTLLISKACPALPSPTISSTTHRSGSPSKYNKCLPHAST